VERNELFFSTCFILGTYRTAPGGYDFEFYSWAKENGLSNAKYTIFVREQLQLIDCTAVCIILKERE